MIEKSFAQYEDQIERLNTEIVALRARNENLEGQLSRAAIAERIVREPSMTAGALLPSYRRVDI